MSGIRIVRQGRGPGVKPKTVKPALPSISEDEIVQALLEASKPVEDPIPPGFISVDRLKDTLRVHGGSSIRHIRRLFVGGKLKRITLRRFGIDGHIKYCAFYKIVK